ncbi:MAG: hypothetical protein A2054_05210 [Deltaproteobacteria bacterium GWA2_55_10]|nr:MAG: hypothetical protein A2054_05210 [Deltaproteobacteria bacterium GWA2_55_10]
MTHHEPGYWYTEEGINVGAGERLISVALGGLLAAKGVRKGSFGGLLTALTGGYLMYRGSTGHCALYDRLGVKTSGGPIEIHESITVNRPVYELYGFWRNLENLPEVMSHLEEVKVIDSRRSHWGAIAPGGIKVEWDAEITDERENEYIAWRSLPYSDIDTEGLVEFRKAPGNRGTELRLHMAYNLPGGAPPAVQKLLGTLSFRQLREELIHFKQVMEASGEPSAEERGRWRASGE